MRIILFLILSFSIGATVIPDRDSSGNLINRLDTFVSKGNHKFRGTGKKFTAAANATTNMEYAVEYGVVKINGLEIIGGNAGDSVNIKVLDTAQGTYSGTPNLQLEQFCFTWNIKNDSIKDILPYYLEGYSGMRIIIEYTNAGAEKSIGVNYYLHEVVP